MSQNKNCLPKSNVILSGAKKQRSMKSISCALDCVSEILHCVQDDKMKMDFYFDTTSDILAGVIENVSK